MIDNTKQAFDLLTRQKHGDFVSFIDNNVVDLNKIDSSGFTLLAWAIYLEQYELAKILIYRGANIEQQLGIPEIGTPLKLLFKRKVVIINKIEELLEQEEYSYDRLLNYNYKYMRYSKVEEAWREHKLEEEKRRRYEESNKKGQ